MEHPKEKKRNAMVLVQSEIVMWKRKKKKERVQGVKVAGSRRDSTLRRSISTHREVLQLHPELFVAW